VFAAIAGVAALGSVFYARKTVQDGKELTAATRSLVEESERSRTAAAVDDRRRRLVGIGELEENLFWAAESSETERLKGGNSLVTREVVELNRRWMAMRNHLRSLLSGLMEELPASRVLSECAAADQAVQAARPAILEVENLLNRLPQVEDSSEAL
jgi:hypothetical protein